MTDEDINELLSVVDENIPSVPEQYDSSVKTWITKMLGKAVDGSWQVGIGAAGSILADALAVHYGLK